jgi:hypothetical protein
MTLINCTSSAIYTKDFSLKDKIQLYGMAALFLVLLYNSPAGLVLYWTLNNVFSLVKNLLQKIKRPGRVVYLALCPCIVFMDIYLLFIHQGFLSKRLFLAGVCSVFFLIPLFIKLTGITQKFKQKINLRDTVLSYTRTFVCAGIILFLLTGWVIPSALMSSSPAEFSFIENYASPFPFIGTTLLQGAGFFLFWTLCVYFLFSKRIQIILTVFLSLFEITALVNTFVFPGNYGFLTTTLNFSNANELNAVNAFGIINIFVLIAAIALFGFLLFSKRKTIFYSVQIIILISLTTLGIINSLKIYQGYSELARRKIENPGDINNGDLNPIYHFSKNGKNVVVIMLDRAISGYVPYILKEKPKLNESFRDFVYYPNCVSLGGYTLLGAPSLFGGYEYSPEEMQKRDKELLVNKHNEALLVLPRLFSENNFDVTVTDPPWANFRLVSDVSIFNDYKNVYAKNLNGRYIGDWLRKHADVHVISIAALLKNNLMRFSIFKIAPVFFRSVLYNDGDWLVMTEFSVKNSTITEKTIDNYSMLDVLPKITAIEDNTRNTYTALVNDLTHEPAFFEASEYVPIDNITNYGSSPFSKEEHYHANMAALSLLGKWFDFFKQEGIYDNTRIIITSDHGWYFQSGLPNNFSLPNGRVLLGYNPLLLVKDFSAVSDANHSGLVTDNTFMTHADVPFLASKDITDAKNPFTNKMLYNDKQNGVIISTVNSWESPDPAKYTWDIQSDEWLHVHDNIFDEKNWEKAEK